MKYQTIYLHLTDGRIIKATVPAFMEEGDRFIVENVQVSQPKELPDGCKFEELEDNIP